MKVVKISIVVIFSMLFAVACGSTATNVTNGGGNSVTRATNSGAPTGTPAAIDTAKLDDNDTGGAKEIYATNCMICHKEDGTGGKVTVGGKDLDAENLTEDKIKKMSDEKLIGYVTNGIPDEGMPAFKDKLTPGQIRTVVAHVRTLQQ